MSNSLLFPLPVPSLVGCEMLGLDARTADPTVGTLTVIMQQFLDEVDVGEDHSSTAVPLELELVEGLAEMQVRHEGGYEAQQAHPSVMSLASSSRYAFHLSPMTLPHEKQRTGMIYRGGISDWRAV